MGATVVLGAGVNGLKNANEAIQNDNTADITPESMTPVVDTRAQQRGVEMIQHEILARPGLRVRVRGTIDNETTLSGLSGFGGTSEIFDNRDRLDDGVLDNIMASRIR